MTSTTSSKKILCIFDLNKTLMLVTKSGKFKTFGPGSILDSRTPDAKTRDERVFFREGRNELLDYLFLKNRDFIDVGVWSSVDKDKTSFLAKAFFERYYRNLLFISATRREEYEGIKDEYSYEPIKIQRDLTQLFEKFPKYDKNNTIVVSNFPNLLEQHAMNDLLLSQYDPNILGVKFQGDLTLYVLTKFLTGIKHMLVKKDFPDVRAILSSKSLQFMLERTENTNATYDKYT